MDHVPCSDEFFIKRLISIKRKKERLGLHFNEFFQKKFFMIHEATPYTLLHRIN